ncbi:MAG: YfcE family phosphodiesterase [Treponemataceae bacterium]|nr:YfcE family phosphodiesterase [Treponemataceae bacterium]
MNGLTQVRTGLIGSVDDIEKLASAKKATVLVLSDIHCDDFGLLLEIMKQFGADSDALVYCGDGIRDFARLFLEASSDEKIRATIPPVVAFARGNGDYNEYLGGSVRFDVPDAITFKAAGRTIFATHGHLFGVDFGTDHICSVASASKASLVFYGHTHCPYKKMQDNVVVLNPGSVTRPRNGSCPSFAVVTYPGVSEKFEISFFGIKHIPFGHYQFSLISI